MVGEKSMIGEIHIYSKTVLCTKCGGVAFGPLRSTGDFYCKCPIEHQSQSNLTGWECPRCHRIHSPYTTECYCPPTIRISTSTQ